MDEHIEEHWLTLTAAAERIGVSYRTLQRRIKAGSFQTRTTPNGTLEVLVPIVADGGSHGADSDGQQDTDSQGPPELATALALAGTAGSAIRMADQTAMLCREQAEEARSDARSARRWGRSGWLTAAVLLVGGILAAWYGSKAITTADGRHVATTAQLEAQTARVVDLADQVAAERARADVQQQRGDELGEQLRESTAEGAALAASCDALAEQVAEARAELDAAEAKQAAAMATWAGPAVQIEQGGDVDAPAPGG